MSTQIQEQDLLWQYGTLMAAKLRLNCTKPLWTHGDFNHWVKRIHDEVAELDAEIAKSPKNNKDILEELADIGNFCAMATAAILRSCENSA